MATDKRMDRFFRRKLEGRSFEFDNHHWLAAQALIEQQERRRRRVFFWWLLFGLLFIGAGIPAGYWWWSQKHSLQPVALPMPALPAPQALDVQPATGEEELPIVRPGQHLKPTAAIPKKSPAVISAGSDSHFSEKLASKPIPASRPSITNTETAEPTAASTSHEHLFSAEPAPSPVPAALPALLQALASLPASAVLPSVNLLETQAIHPAVFRPRLHQEMRLGASWKPGWDEPGFSAGLGFNWRFQQHWGLQFGLAYHRKPDQAQPIDQAVEYRYGFGLSETRYTLRPQSLHLLEAPLNVFWQSGRRRIELGASPAYLIGARGALALDTIGEPAGFKALKTGWLATDGLRSWQLSLGAAYRYYFDTRWALGGRFEYALIREPKRSEEARYTAQLQLIYLLP